MTKPSLRLLPAGKISRKQRQQKRNAAASSNDKAKRELGMKFNSGRRALEKAFVWFREHGYIR